MRHPGIDRVLGAKHVSNPGENKKENKVEPPLICSIVRLLLKADAVLPWSPERHFLHPPATRSAITLLILVAARMRKLSDADDTCMLELPTPSNVDDTGMLVLPIPSNVDDAGMLELYVPERVGQVLLPHEIWLVVGGFVLRGWWPDHGRAALSGVSGTD